MMDDAELLRQYATERSDPAFAELVRRHVDLVYSVALRKVGGDAHAAQDVAQAVFIALARNAASLAQRRALVGWVYLTTHYQAAQWVRSDRRRQVREHDLRIAIDRRGGTAEIRERDFAFENAAVAECGTDGAVRSGARECRFQLQIFVCEQGVRRVFLRDRGSIRDAA